MANSSSHQAKSIASQCENPFVNLECRRDQEGSVHVTHTSKSHSRVESHVSQEQHNKAMQREIDQLKKNYAMHNENELTPHLVPPSTMRKIAVIDVDQGLPLANPSHMKKSVIVNADAKVPFTKDWVMMR